MPQMTDEQLIPLATSGDITALNELLTRYKTAVLAQARRASLRGGGETDDLVQEGMCGLYSAICRYKEGGSASFSTFAAVCVKNSIIDAVRLNTGNKNSALNASLPLNEETERATPINPEDEVIAVEDFNEIYSRIEKELSPLEYGAFKLYSEGFKMCEIASELNTGLKGASNAVTRSKRKIYKLIRAEK